MSAFICKLSSGYNNAVWMRQFDIIPDIVNCVFNNKIVKATTKELATANGHIIQLTNNINMECLYGQTLDVYLKDPTLIETNAAIKVCLIGDSIEIVTERIKRTSEIDIYEDIDDAGIDDDFENHPCLNLEWQTSI